MMRSRSLDLTPIFIHGWLMPANASDSEGVAMVANFRGYLDTLKKNDELTVISKPTDLRDVAALVRHRAKALLFTKWRGYSMPVAWGLLKSGKAMLWGREGPYEKIESKWRAGMDHRLSRSGRQKRRSKKLFEQRT